MKRSMPAAAALLWVLTGSLAAYAATPLQEALRAMAAGDLGRAQDALSRLVRGNDAVSLEARLLTGRALFLAGRIDEAAQTFQRVLKADPTGRFGIKARFALAECRARQKDFESAERLYAEALQLLDAPAYVEEIARRFIELAEEALRPSERKEPDPARAERLLRRALELLRKGPLAEDIELRIARCQVRQKQYAGAAAFLEPILKRTPAPARADEIRYRLAQALHKAGNPSGARRFIREILDQQPPSAYRASAQFLLSRSYGFPTPKTIHDLFEGREALRLFIAEYPSDRRVEQARRELFLAPLAWNRFCEAEDEIRAAIRQGGPVDFLGTARFHLGVVLAGQGRLEEAAAAYQEYLQEHPAHTHWLQARAALEDLAWEMGERAGSKKDWPLAAKKYEEFAERFPASPRAPLGLRRAADACVEQKQIDRALSLLNLLSAKFSTSPEAIPAQLEAARLWEEEKLDAARAREILRKLESTHKNGEAAARLLALDQPSLVIEKHPVFRSGEKPHLVWRTRNLKAVAIRSFKLRAEDFFREHLSFEELHNVDIALCTPDASWTVPVRDFRRNVRLRQEVELPFARPGLYLVQLSAGKLEATTIVLVSDLGLILKRSPDELFVFAQDHKKLAPVAEARLIVANAREIVAEGKTDEEGVFRKTWPAGRQSEPLSVLAILGEHIVWSGAEESEGNQEAEPTARAFVFSDRPAYRPGDEVHLAGILRPVPGPVPTFLPGGKWTVTVSCNGQTLWESPATLDEFGVFSTALRLEPDAPQGSCNFSVTDGLKSFSGSFLVTEFRRLPMQVQVALDRPVVYQGEAIEGFIEVRHAHGALAAGEKVLYRLSTPAAWRHTFYSNDQVRFRDSSGSESKDTPWQEALTDESGRVRFSFSTRGFEEETRREIQVRLPVHKQVAEATVVVSVAQFSANLKLGHPAVVAGVPFPVSLELRGPDGTPRAGSAVVEAFFLPSAGREERVERREVVVPDTGEAVLMFTLARPGAHALRLLAWDRARHPVVAELGLTVAGAEEDGLSLELDRTEYAVGSAARITLRNQGKENLILLTEETERVLRHRAVRVRTGATSVEWPIRPELAPNFLLAAAALNGDRLWQAGREVKVSQALTLSLVTDRKSYQPGDEVTVTLSARDAAGRPADARMILSAVDETLLRTFPEGLPGLLDSFFTERMLGQLQTTGSNGTCFEEVEAEESEEAEVLETEGSAAMAALRERRKSVTDKGAGLLGNVMGDSVGVGGLGTRGYGSGGGGAAYGRAGGVSSMRVGNAVVHGGDQGWLRQHFAETAAFLADLRTGPDGVVSATFRLPDNLTTWRLLARAVTRDTKLGEIQVSRPAEKAFFADLIVPPEIEEGDALEPLVRIFNDSPVPRKVRIELNAAPAPETRELEVPANRTAEARFGARQAPAAGSRLILSVSATAGPLADRLKKEIPVRPRGARVGRTLLGVTDKAAAIRFDLEDSWKDPAVRLAVSLNPTRFLLGAGFDPLWFSDRPEEALLSIRLLRLLGPKPHPAMLEPVRQRLRSVLNRLLRAQYPNGAFGLTRTYAYNDLSVTCSAVRALAEARPLLGELRLNISQEPLDRAVTYLREQLASLPPDDWTSRATAIWALATVGEAQVPTVQLHRLHRLRGQLPPEALVRLGLAWLALGRTEQATEVLRTLRPSLKFGDAPPTSRRFAIFSCGSSRRILFEALRLLAALSPTDPLTADGTRWLWNESTSVGFFGVEEAEAALQAMLDTQPAALKGGRADVQVSCNGAPVSTLRLGPDRDDTEVDLPRNCLRTGKNVLELRVDGSGAVLYQAAFSAWNPGPFGVERQAGPVFMSRHVDLLPALYRGEEIQRGFGALQAGTQPWNDDIADLPAGRRARVTIEVWAKKDVLLPQLAVEERLPAGVELVEGSTGRGSFGMLQQGRRLAFFLPPGEGTRRISYDIEGVFSGQWRFGPLRAISLVRPEDELMVQEYALAVTAPGAPGPNVRPTPDELLDRGSLAARFEEHPTVIETLEPLLAMTALREEYLGAVLGHLLFSSIALSDHERTLKYFELTKEKNPDFVIPFDKLAAIQHSYRAQKVFEGGVHLARGVADALFMRDVRQVGMLVNEEEVAEAIRLFDRFAGAYPASAQNALARYAFSQRLFSRADRLADGETLPGFDRPGLLSAVSEQMSRYLAEHPEHPHASDAFLSLASAHLERGDFDESIAWGRAGLARHPESDMAPAIRYFLAFAHFRQGHFDEALRLCQEVTKASEDDDNGAMATYIMAQIHHARGNIQRARELYQKIEGRFRDAAETLADFERERFTLPELINAPAGREVVLPLQLQNIRRVDLRAYPVDLPRLVRLKGSLEKFSDINLAGIQPVWSRTLEVPLSDGRLQSVEVRPALGPRGAFLVLARAGARVTHALVLRDSLQLDVIHNPSESRIRVTVRDSRGRPIPGARVLLRGSESSRFLAGNTDLRGIFVADEVDGTVTVVGSHQGAFGLFRSADASPGEEDEPPPLRVPKPGPPKTKRGQKTQIDFEDVPVDGMLQKMDANAGQQFFDEAEQTQGMTAKQAM